MTPVKSEGYCPLELNAAIEKVVVDGNRRKYVQLGRPLRFYGGVTSATEVGCNLRCKFCFSDQPVWKPGRTGRFYAPQEVFQGLDKAAKRYGHKLISASASEGTMGRRHLTELLTLVDQSPYVYILETNGMVLGASPSYCEALSAFKRLHVRVSIKGCNEEEYHQLTGAQRCSYQLPFEALRKLIELGVSCNVSATVSFSEKGAVDELKQRLFEVYPGLLKSMEQETITLFPKVAQRLAKEELRPVKVKMLGFDRSKAAERREASYAHHG